jgi:hypothetical protein
MIKLLRSKEKIMTLFTAISYLVSTLFAAGAVYVWSKFSDDVVETLIIGVSTWLSSLAVFNLVGLVK